MAAGNCTVLKPSEFEPHTAAAIARLMREDFAQEYVVVFEGERDVAEALLPERFNKIFSPAARTWAGWSWRPLPNISHQSHSNSAVNALVWCALMRRLRSGRAGLPGASS